MDDSLKTIQEAYDKCNFSDEIKKTFPRPESEEDLKQFNNSVFTPTPGCNFGWGMGLLGFLLGSLLLPSFGCCPINSEALLKETLKESENKCEEEKIDN